MSAGTQATLDTAPLANSVGQGTNVISYDTVLGCEDTYDVEADVTCTMVYY
jgi:hypothetical protein